MKNLIFSLLVLIISVVWAGKGIFKYNVFSTHDGNHHIARSFDAVKTFSEGHFPIRWAGSLNYQCGVPIYNFFYPLIYYFVIFINFLTNDIIFSLKIIYFLSLLLGTIFFYLWMREETKNNIAAFGGAFLYLFAPYRFSLIFVRGSPEFLAYAILPIVLYFYALCLNSVGHRVVVYAFLASLAGALLTISHNFTVMFLTPLILLHLLVKILTEKVDRSKVLWVFISFVGSLLLSSFFIGPALLEKKFTKIGDNFLMWREHFPTLEQLIKSKWGYFYSSLGTHNDGMSFMLGYAQWLVLALAVIVIVTKFVKSQSRTFDFVKNNVWILIYFLLSLFVIYLILPWSIPLWEKLSLLQEIQFSWRLLGVAIFTISALFSFILAGIKPRSIVVILLIGVGFLGVYGNRNHLLPQPVSVEDLYRFDDFEKLHYHRYSTTTLGDDVIYPTAAKACWFDEKVIFDSEGEALPQKLVSKGNTFGSVRFEINKEQLNERINLHLGYFPGIYGFDVNGVKVGSYSDCNGLVCIDAGNFRGGANFLSWNIGQSPVETFFNVLTVVTLALWLVLLFVRFSGLYKDRSKLVTFLVFLAIAATFIFFRTYNLDQRVGFSWDQERDARAVTDILSGKFTLLGPRVQGPTGFFLPPYFYYLLVPFYFISGGNPVASLLFIIFCALAFLVLGFYILYRVFGREVALIFTILWGVHPSTISTDIIAWNPIVIPLSFLLLILLVYKYLVRASNRALFLSGLMIGIGISFHVQFVFAGFLLAPILYDLIKTKRIKSTILLAVGVLLPFLPILLFDLRHEFLNLKNILAFSPEAGFSGNRALIVWSRFISFLTGIESSALLGLSVYFAILLSFVFILKNIKDNVHKKLFLGLGLVWVVSLPVFYLFLKNPSEYYFNFLLIPMFILVAYLFTKLRNTLRLIVIFVLVLILVYKTIPTLKSSYYTFEEKRRSVLFLREVTKNTAGFNVSFDVPFNEDSGFRYFLDYYKVQYSGRSSDPLIEFVIPPSRKPGSFVIGKVGIYIPSGWIDDNWVE